MRRDIWWLQPAAVLFGLSCFIVYATWAAFQGTHYHYGPYLSPFYSPEIFGESEHSWFGPKPGALKICESAPEGSNVLCMLPDTGERYLSTPLFADIPEDMTQEEVEISTSTPNYRFDVQAAPPLPFAVGDDKPVEVTDKGVSFVKDVTGNPENPVVMFGLEWCEFCWSARNLFNRLEIPYRDIELDAVEYQEDNWGAKIRAALADTTQSGTVPQIFVGGEFIGGATDIFDAYNEGRLQALLKEKGVHYDADQSLDPYSFLPGWLHKR
jgi:cysteine synthase A